MQICIAGRMHFSKKKLSNMFFSNCNKEPEEEKIYRWTEFFHKLDNSGWKMHTGACARKQKYICIYIYISLSENLFENGCTRDDAVVRAPISHQCDSSLNPGIVVMWGSLLCSETFSLVHNTPAFPSPENQHFQSPIAPGM